MVVALARPAALALSSGGGKPTAIVVGIATRADGASVSTVSLWTRSIRAPPMGRFAILRIVGQSGESSRPD
jgi:hypothetical protein